MFVDTLPNPQGAEGGDAGERQGGRRRNRRGGRGRDRDDARPGERSDASPEANGNADVGATMSVPSAEPARAGESWAEGTNANGDDRTAETGEARRDDSVAAPVGEAGTSEPRGEGSRRRGRGGRGRDRERPAREGDAVGAEALAGQGSEGGAMADRTRTPFGVDAESRAEPSDDERPREPMTATAATPSMRDAAPPFTREATPFTHAEETPRDTAHADQARRDAEPDAWRLPEPAPRSMAPASERREARAEPALAEPSAPAAAPYALPLDSLVAVAESAGLQWVNSDAGKIEAAQAAMAAAAAPIHVPRDIPEVAAVDAGPLVLVETKKDLSQVKLPFETTPRETQGL
jgi:ribonuclease E